MIMLKHAETRHAGDAPLLNESDDVKGVFVLKNHIRLFPRLDFPVRKLIVTTNVGIRLLFGLLGAQHLRLLAQPQSPVKYEVASIRRSKSGDPRRHEMEFLPGGRFRSMNIPFFQVLATAYNI